MKAQSFRLTNLVLVLGLLLSLSAPAGDSSARSISASAALQRDAASSSNTPQPDSAAILEQAREAQPFFIQNRGQVHGPAAYYLQGQNATIYFAPGGLTYSLTEASLTGAEAPQTVPDPPEESESVSGPTEAGPPLSNTPPSRAAPAARWVLKLDFLGADPGVTLQGQDPATPRISYFIGPREQWHTGLPTFHRLIYANLWPGIDLVYSTTPGQLKYEFVVQPGADPGQIRLAYRGASELKLDPTGRLEVSTPFGSLSDQAPLAYQLSGEQQVPVAAAYALEDGGSDSGVRSTSGGRSTGGAFQSGDEVHLSKDLTEFRRASSIPNRNDTMRRNLAPSLGGKGEEEKNLPSLISLEGTPSRPGKGPRFAPRTSVRSFLEPETHPFAYGFQVAEYDPSLPLIIDPAIIYFCGYIGGSSDEAAQAVAVDSARSIYVTGYTYSTEATFPERVGPDKTHNGLRDVFVAKVDTYGDLVYAGFIGGSQDDIGNGIAVDSNGDAYVVGQTKSDQATFPVLIGPDLTHNGNYDAFIVKVHPLGETLLYAGYIGGTGDDYANAVAVDAAGATYIAGKTGSSETAGFPVVTGPDRTYNVAGDAFVARLRPDGAWLTYCGYIGGGGQDEGWAIAVDAAGAAYVAGITSSTEATFPVAAGPDLTFNGGTYDAFVVKVRPDGSALVYAGYIGGPGMDFGYGLAVDATGAAYVAGSTNSPILNHSGGYDAFVAKVRPDGSALLKAGLIGGANDDFGTGIGVDSDYGVYVTGYTSSDQTTFPIINGPDKTFNGGEDAFVVKISSQWKEYVYSGYIGGSSADRARGIAVDWRGSAYVVGMTMSTYTTFPISMGPDTTYNGAYDAFVAKINMIYKTYLPVVSRQ